MVHFTLPTYIDQGEGDRGEDETSAPPREERKERKKERKICTIYTLWCVITAQRVE